MNETAIGWTDFSWNVWSGCKKIDPCCAHCYADTFAERHRGNAAFPHGFDLTVRKHKLAEPAKLLRSKGPSLIFCESMSDIGLDDDELSEQETHRLRWEGYADLDKLRDDFFDVTEDVAAHRYQVLTKRGGRLLRYFRERGRRVPASVWIGVTIGHERSLSRLPDLLAFRDLGARVLFISAEPLLSDLVSAGLRLDGVDWLIGGGESGTHASNEKARRERFLVERTLWVKQHRDREPTVKLVGPWRPNQERARWIAKLRDEAARAGCAFFFKQWGGPKPDSGGRLLDGVEHDGMPSHVPGAMPDRRAQIGAATAALARKRGLPIVP